MSAKTDTSTPKDAAIEHETAETLLSLVRRLEHELLTTLDADSPQQAVDSLLTSVECLDELDTALAELDPQVTGPLVQRLRLGLDRLACDLYRRGGWQHLDESQRQALLARHATGLTQVDGIGPASAQVLFLHGISDPERLCQWEPDALDDIEGLNAAVLARLKRELEASRKSGAE
ncbi:helix-hairpin-helix domain-containing protein [Billgrantia desiderata]|uniref:helix-hairpin-helix domain-containing protein n=1 Tax=Billgrantia desiderata TaxID=52021 RepID=UPI003F40490B